VCLRGTNRKGIFLQAIRIVLMKIQVILLVSLLIGLIHPKEKVRIKNFELEIPEQLEKVKPNEQYNELLKLSYKKELQIIIADDIGSTFKKEERNEIYDAFDLLVATFKIKYEGWFNAYKGYEKGELKKHKINSFKAVSKDFKTNINGTIIYFEITTINIGDYYYDLIVTGKDELRNSHQSIVRELKNSIKKISDN